MRELPLHVGFDERAKLFCAQASPVVCCTFFKRKSWCELPDPSIWDIAAA